MKHKIIIHIPNSENIALELDYSVAPKTVSAILQNLPFALKANVWGKEIYTDPAPISAKPENAKDLVQLYDVAFWPRGNAICLFYGPTPMSTGDEIRPYSPVNVIGKIIAPDATILKKVSDKVLTFTKS